MASTIYVRDRNLVVSNRRFSTLIEFGIAIAKASSPSADEMSFITRLENETDAHYPGFDLDLESDFPETACRQFWAKVFLDVGRAIFRRELGNQTVTHWQASMICDSHTVARMLIELVQREIPTWSPKSKDQIEWEASFPDKDA